MTLNDYYEILGLPVNSSVDEIKQAYRKKARLYHPDINPSPDAKDLFINITEAYEFLISNHDKIITDDQAYYQAMEENTGRTVPVNVPQHIPVHLTGHSEIPIYTKPPGYLTAQLSLSVL
jgi:DnaJ-class molecular chaperone